VHGIALAGGRGLRLHPLTSAVSKQLLPVYNKPMIYYPIATLMTAGVKDISIITNPEEKSSFQRLLGDGSDLGICFTYINQPSPDGIAQAFTLASHEIAGKKVALILGDNIFHGSGLGRALSLFKEVSGAQIFAYKVSNASDYGIVEFSKDGDVVSIEEKPKIPKSDFAIPGLYFVDENVIEIASRVKPSKRGELEITSILNEYLESDRLQVSVLPRGTAWLDTGTFESLHNASSYIKLIEERQGSKVGCLEEIAFRQKLITQVDLEKIATTKYNGEYRDYLLRLSLESN